MKRRLTILPPTDDGDRYEAQIAESAGRLAMAQARDVDAARAFEAAARLYQGNDDQGARRCVLLWSALAQYGVTT